MPDLATSDDYLRGLLRKVKTIAVVGVSPNPARPSYEVFAFLLSRGYRLTGVNPALAGKTLLGAPCVGTLKDLPGPADMIDVFRNSAAAGDVVTEVLALDWRPLVIWMQLGVRNEAAAVLAAAQGIEVVMDRCPKIEYGRLSLGREREGAA
jgi:predicted CoA-binding protein